MVKTTLLHEINSIFRYQSLPILISQPIFLLSIPSIFHYSVFVDKEALLIIQLKSLETLLKFGNKLIFTICTAVFLSLLTKGILQYKSTKMLLGDRVNNIAIINLLTQRANDLEKEFSQDIKTARKLSADPIIINWLNTPNQNKISREKAFEKLEKKAKKIGNSIPFAASHRSQTLFKGGSPNPIQLSSLNSEDEWYFDFISSGKPFDINIEEKEAIYLNVRVGTQQDPLGAVGFGYPLEEVTKWLARHSFGEHGDIWFINKKGKVLFNRNSNQIGKNILEQLPQITIKDFIDGEKISNIEVFNAAQKSEFAVALNKISNTNLIIVTKVYTQQWLDNHMSPFLISALISSSISFFLVMLIVVLFSISLRRSVGRISTAIQDLGEGKFNAQLCPVDLGRKDEFGDMARGCDEAQKKLSRMVKKLEQQKEEFQTLVHNIPLGIFRNFCQVEGGALLQANPSMWKLFGYASEEEFRDISISDTFISPDERDLFFQNVQKGSCRNFEARLKKKDGGILICSLNAEVYYDSKTGNRYIDGIIEDITERKKAETLLKNYSQTLEQQVRKRTEKLDNALVKVKDANEKITDSIRYARRIQQSLLPDKSIVQSILPNSFIHWNPRFYVGGDMFNTFRQGDKSIISVIDCTGHGVPGALMTMLSTSILRNTVLVENCFSTAEILRRLNVSIKKNLQQNLNNTSSDDGLDAAICSIDHKTKRVTFSGARLPLLYVKDETLKMIKGDRSSIGYRRSKVDFKFQEHTVETDSDTTFYMYTDGYTDQLGEKRRLSFGSRQLRQILQNIHKKPLDEQKNTLIQKFNEYKGDFEQVDDVTIMGFKIS